MSDRLRARGSVIIDADEVVKGLQQPGRPVFEAMVQRWGDAIVGADGHLDRAAVASLVFSDAGELNALNAMVHPAVVAEMRAQADVAVAGAGGDGGGDQVVVFDIPLLVEGDPDQWGHSAVIVVDCPPEVAVERLVAHRGFDAEDARARMAKQATREDRLAIADFVVDNGGDVNQLDTEVERCWTWLATLDPTPWPPPGSEGVTGDQ